MRKKRGFDEHTCLQCLACRPGLLRCNPGEAQALAEHLLNIAEIRATRLTRFLPVKL